MSLNSLPTDSDTCVALITGTSKGIGKSLANFLLSKNYKVIGCSRGESIISHDDYTHFRVNVNDESETRSIFKHIRKTYNRLDILINNAAINPAISPLITISLDKAKETFDTNFFAPLLWSRQAAKLMLKRKYGRIINISSMAVKHEVKGEIIYTASKAALHSLTRIAAKELYPLGITCNVVAPAAIPTELSEQIDQAALQEVLNRNAIPEYGNFSDVSQAVNWIISKNSQAITGQVIYLGGV